MTFEDRPLWQRSFEANVAELEATYRPEPASQAAVHAYVVLLNELSRQGRRTVRRGESVLLPAGYEHVSVTDRHGRAVACISALRPGAVTADEVIAAVTNWGRKPFEVIKAIIRPTEEPTILHLVVGDFRSARSEGG